jgi:hypothetical protein
MVFSLKFAGVERLDALLGPGSRRVPPRRQPRRSQPGNPDRACDRREWIFDEPRPGDFGVALVGFVLLTAWRTAAAGRHQQRARRPRAGYGQTSAPCPV